MKNTDICRMCDNYATDAKCEIQADCAIMAVLRENADLKKQVANLQKELTDARIKMSYMINPNAIGNRNDMGW